MRPRLLALLLAATPALAGAAGFTAPTVGPETCKACHPSAYEAWTRGPHVRAFDSLPERSRKDKRCLSCHSPLQEDGFGGVGCESCHGAGGAYSARYVMRDPELSRAVGLLDPNEKTCGGCHNDSTPSLARFELKRKLPLIEHWSAEREARKAAAASAAAKAAPEPKKAPAEPKKGAGPHPR